jgi:NAD(P)-dependent dehydrogenase (short-subunit alcohol dehydrogenase family)
MHLEGKAAIVTGAGRGIGRDVALLLAREGAKVIVNDPGVGRGGEPTEERPADDVVNEIRAAGGMAIANYDSLTRSIAKETAKFGITCNAICPAADTRMMMNEAVIANQKRKLEAGLITQDQYDRFFAGRGPEHIAPMVAYLATDGADLINGHVFHVEKGRINSYFYGEDFKTLTNDGSLFTVSQLAELIPATVAQGLTPVVPAVKMADAVRAGETSSKSAA